MHCMVYKLGFSLSKLSKCKTPSLYPVVGIEPCADKRNLCFPCQGQIFLPHYIRIQHLTNLKSKRMFRPQLFTFLMLWLFAVGASAQSWVNTYAGEGSITGIVEAQDGNVIIHGDDGTVSKVNPLDGSIVWTLGESVGTPAPNGHTYQSAARIGNQIMVVARDKWVLLDDAGATATVIQKGTWGDHPVSGVETTEIPCRVKAIDGAFYIVGGYEILGGTFIGTGGLIQRFNPGTTTGTVEWTRLPVAPTYGMSPTNVRSRNRTFIPDILPLSGNRLLVSYGFFPTASLYFIILDANTGDILQRLQPDVSAIGTHGFSVTSMEKLGAGDEVLMVGFQTPGTGVGLKAFGIGYNFTTEEVMFANELTWSGGSIYPTTVRKEGSDMYLAGALVNSTSGAETLFVGRVGENANLTDINGNVTFGDGPSGPHGVGGHCVAFIDGSYYVGGSSITLDEPVLMRKAAGENFADLCCASEYTPDAAAFTIPPVTPIDASGMALFHSSIDVIPSVGSGAVQNPDACFSPTVDFIGGPTVSCGFDPLFLDATQPGSSGPGYTYEWTSLSGGPFIGTSDPAIIEIPDLDQPDGFYSYEVTITTPGGCVRTAIGTVEVVEALTVTLPDFYCLATSTSCVDFFTAATGTFTVTGPGVSSDGASPIETFTFCPDAAGAGTHTITIESFATTCGTIETVEVVASAYPRTTNGSGGDDESVDVEVDNYGNVYTGGNFRNFTNFEALTIANPSSTDPTMFLTKYDDCGDLKWVAHARGGKGITVRKTEIDHNRELVYVLGTTEGNAIFQSGIQEDGSPSCAGGSSITGYHLSRRFRRGIQLRWMLVAFRANHVRLISRVARHGYWSS